MTNAPEPGPRDPDGPTRPERRRPSRAGRGGSLLELALLGVLAEGPQHGYGLKKQLDAVLPAWSSVSYGSLYPTLGRLERAGDLVAIDTDDGDESIGEDDSNWQDTTPADGDATAPLTGTLAGELATFRARLRDRTTRSGRPRRTGRSQRGQRGRKAYGITTSGRARLHELLTSLDPADDRAFALQVAFAAHLDTAERLAVLGRRRGELTARLDGSSTTPEPADRWQASLRRHTLDVLAAELAWVDSLLAGVDLPSPTIPPETAEVTTGGTP